MPRSASQYPLGGEKTLERIVADCRTLGIVGERDLLLTIYLVGVSRLLDNPLSAIVRGKSSSGKSHVVNQIARLFPPEQVIVATRMTPQALYHMESVAHKFVVAGERSRVQDDAAADATGALRQLQSERRITKQIAEKGDNGKFVTRAVEIEGPIAYVETTTLAPGRIFPEDLNRALLLTTDESEKQTKDILKRLAKRCGGASRPEDAEAIVQAHRDFQARLQGYKVLIPFADRLLDALPTRKVEARRVGQQVVSMIGAVALLHQQEREPDPEGRIVATAADYGVASRLLRQPLGASLGVGAGTSALYGQLSEEFEGEAFSTAQAQKLDLEAGERTVRGWLAELAEQGCVEQVQAGRGPKPAIWRLTGKTPGGAVLPTWEAIKS